jgi:hypothetical protein
MPTKSDYLQSLRQNLPYRELRVLVEAFCEVLPGFNCEVVGTMPIERLAAISAALHVLIELSPHDGDGLALWGFFLKRKEGLLECPLIFKYCSSPIGGIISLLS